MSQRLIAASSLALLGTFAFTGIAGAAKGPDAAEVAIGTALAVVVLMAFLALMYGLKIALGLVQKLPPPAEEPHGNHH